MASSPIMFTDPDVGDEFIITFLSSGSYATHTFTKISRSTILAASPYLHGLFSRSHNKGPSCTVHLSNSGIESCRTLLNVLHGNTLTKRAAVELPGAPESPESIRQYLEHFFDLCVLSSKWQCLPTIRKKLPPSMFPEDDPLEGLEAEPNVTAEKAEEFERWIVVAVMMRNQKLFRMLTGKGIALCSTGTGKFMLTEGYQPEMLKQPLMDAIKKKAFTIGFDIAKSLCSQQTKLLHTSAAASNCSGPAKEHLKCRIIAMGFLEHIIQDLGFKKVTSKDGKKWAIVCVYRTVARLIHGLATWHGRWSEMWVTEGALGKTLFDVGLDLGEFSGQVLVGLEKFGVEGEDRVENPNKRKRGSDRIKEELEEPERAVKRVAEGLSKLTCEDSQAV